MFFVVSAAIPLVFTMSGIDPAFSVRAVLLALLTIGGLWYKRQSKIRPSLLLVFWGIYALAMLVSIGRATNLGEAVYVASMVLLYFGFFITVREFVTPAFVLPIAKIFSVLALLLSFIALVQFYNLGFRWEVGTDPPHGTMLTKNMLSSFLFMLLPMVVFVALTEDHGWRWAGIAAWTMVTLTLLLARSRGAWFGFCVFTFVTATQLLLTRTGVRLWWKPILLMSILTAICAVYVFNFADYSSNIDTRTPREQVRTILHFQTPDTSASMRLTLWEQSATMALATPLGVGAGNWKIVLPKYGLSGYPPYFQNGSVQWTHSHNDFVEVLCESSVVGLLAYIGIFVVTVSISFRTGRRMIEPNNKLLVALLSGTIAGFAAISFFEFPKARVEHMILFAIVVGMVETMATRTPSTKTVAIHPLSIVVFAIPALFLGLIHFVADQHEKNIVLLRQLHRWPAVIEECNKAYNPNLLTLDELCTPLLYYKAEAEFMQNDFQSALRDNLEALKAHPNHFYTLNNTGSCYVKLGNFQAGQEFYQRALAISPNFEESLLNLTALYFDRQDYANALRTVSRCDTTLPGSRAQNFAKVVRARFP